MTFLRIWENLQTYLGGSRSHSKLRRYARENFMSYRRLREWSEVREQIATLLDEDRELHKTTHSPAPKDLYESIHKAILSGYLVNIAERIERNRYRGTRGREIMLFPGSGIFNKGGKWIVAADVVATSRLYARIAAHIEPEWVEEVGKAFCQYTYAEPYWDRERGDVIARERVSFLGLTLCTGRNVSFSRIDPQSAAPIFLRFGLIPGDVKERFRFLRHNLALVAHLREIEQKTRTQGLVDEEAIFDFYAERLEGIASITQLKKLIRTHGGDAFLLLQEEDCLRRSLPVDLDYYPDQVVVTDVALPLTYRFEPGRAEDGVTLTLPGPLFTKLSTPMLDRLVPGCFGRRLPASLPTFRESIVVNFHL